ncbi:MAG: aldo/keto reductase [Gammaproteobacteria bacterium]
MRYRVLGLSGLRVSELCLGAMTFGEEFGIGVAATEARRVYDEFRAAGGNFIDTANIYNRGSSERILGEFIREGREKLVLASKYTLSSDPADPNAGGSHRKNLMQSLDASLRRLGTDYLDVYWVHGWDRRTDLASLMRALDDQVRAGKILHVGISNAPAWVVATANTLATERGLTPFSALQLHYNLIERNIEADFLPMATAMNIAVTAWSPLAGGLLTGKYKESGASGRLAGPRGARTLTSRNQEVATAVAKIAARIDCRPSVLALAWLMQRGNGGVIPIIGARTVEQLRENLTCTGLRLSPEMITELDNLAPPPPTYPASLLGSEFFQDMMYGAVRQQIDWPAS